MGTGSAEPLDVFVHFEHALTEQESLELTKLGGVALRAGRTLVTARVPPASIGPLAASPAVRYISLGRSVMAPR